MISGVLSRRTSAAALASLEAASDACGISVHIADGVFLDELGQRATYALRCSVLSAAK